ncbi:hypothetical protein [Bacillus paramycoides]|uniref:hypothetical protein n=1 Tax=Bacillus paramycoides TaxID=2026194 RepID=UPI0037F1C370
MKYEMTIKEACNSGFWSCLTPTDWIQLGAIIISLFSVLIALYAAIVGRQSAKASEKSSESAKQQLEEMIKQRMDSVRPEMFFENGGLALGYSQGMHLGRFGNGSSAMSVPMTNVGNGHAKKISFEWDFDISSSVELIMENQEEAQYIFEYKEGSRIFFSEIPPISLDLDFKDSSSMLSVDENYEAVLPFSYTNILIIMVHLFYDKRLSLDLIPNLKLSLTYFDVLNNQCSQKFIFKHEITPISSVRTNNKIPDYQVNVVMKVDEIS